MTEDNGLGGAILGSELPEVMDKKLNFGTAGPVLHLDSVDNRGLLDLLLILLNVWLFKIDTEFNVALRAIGLVCGN